jgi:hypothetical protein
MAKTATKSVSKAQLVREVLKADPKTPTKEVIDQLKGKGVKVSANHVYLIKSKMKMRTKRQKREKAVAVSQGAGIQNPAMAVMKVRELASQLGGLKILKQLVDVLSE